VPKKPWKPKLLPLPPGMEETEFQRFERFVRKVIAAPKPKVAEEKEKENS